MDHLFTASDLPWFPISQAGSGAHVFNGGPNGLPAVSVMLGMIRPGERVARHHHDYDELFIFHQGEAMFALGETEIAVGAGHLLLIPAGVVHGFRNVGVHDLHQTAIHLAPEVRIAWDEPPGS